MKNALEAFLASKDGQKLTPELVPFVEKSFAGLGEIHNLAVDHCIELVLKWGKIKQLDQTEDFKALIEFLNKVKEH